MEQVSMRHRNCGEVCCTIDAAVVENPKRRILNTHVTLPDGTHPKPGMMTACQRCGVPFGIGPRWIEVDRGPDAKTSLLQRVALKVAGAVLAGKAA